MRIKTIILPSLLGLALIPTVGAAQQMLTPEEALGKAIFFDENLSLNSNQSCATCHAPEAGWTGPDSDINAHGTVYPGSANTPTTPKFGDRKPPSAAYATQSPVLSVNRKGLFTGGNFWDGRATGERLDSPAAEQAQGPFLNPVEQALNSPADVIDKICANTNLYIAQFKQICGFDACDSANLSKAYDCVGLSIAAYEASPEVNAFTSKFDYSRKGQAKLTWQEQQGWALFKGKGKCAKCHIANGQKPLFTDYTFDNLGIPQNPENPAGVDPAFVDLGLGGFLNNPAMHTHPEWVQLAPENMGKHKVPTLRNVDKRPYPEFVKAFGHNGYFKSLKEIVHFYNTRDVELWPAPEVVATVNTAELP